ncbi:phage tail spike protein [Cytobacillus sp. FSL W8-0315]|uniref:phage tail spike protein n=1 Tax=Cytobacillus sp. FSL W8-0315 TaxID=2921600 RepID=UPI0030F6D8F4
MPELLIFDPDDNLLAVLSNEAEDACFFKTAPFKEVRNQGSFFEFVAQGDHEDSQYLVAENQVAFLDKDGYFRLFVIKEPDQTNGLDGPQIRCVCEPAMNELNEEWIEDVRPYNTTLADAQSRALAGTRWNPGISADLGINSINYYYISVNEAIQENINTWGGELRDRIEIEDNKIVGRYIDILPRRGQDSGKIWEIDKDIISISHKVQSYPKTALYGRGASLETDNGGFTRKITFADIEWKVANGDPVNKPKGQEWVGDTGALAAFGRVNGDGTKRHRKGLYENGQQEDPAVLLQETWEALQQQKHQFHNYEMDVFLLEKISGYDHEKVRLGDTTFAIDRSFANPIEIEQRVISFEYDVADPDNTGTVELGQYIDLYSDDDRLDQVEAQLNNKSGIWNQIEQPITDGKTENITPPKPIDLVATGASKSIIVEWFYLGALYIANYEVYASQVMGFTPDSSNLVFRGNTGMYTHRAESNQQWYFKVRAVNRHGVAGPFSDEATAQTARIISDDILFGPEIAAELRELSKTAGILADGSIDLEQIKQEALDAIQADAKQYTDAEILATEQAIQADLNFRIGNVNSEISNLLQRVSDNELGLAAAGGKITTIEQNINTIDGSLSTTISELSSLDGVVSQQQTTITAMAGQISAKAEKTEVYTKSEVDTSVNDRVSNTTYNNKMSELDISINGISGRVTNTEADINDLTGEVSSAKSQIASLDIKADGIATSVSEVRADLDGLQIGGRNLLKQSGQGYLVRTSYSSAIRIEEGKEALVFESSNNIIYLGASGYNLEVGQEYTFSFFAKASEALSLGFVYISSGNTNFLSGQLITTAWVKYQFTFIASNSNPVAVHMYPRISNGDGTYKSFFITDWKLEKGSVATDWEPSVEDINTRFSSSETKINQNATQIGLKASQTSVDSLTGRMSQAESSINVMSTEISLKVNSDDVIAAINLQPGTVKIKAGLIDLVGDVYITNGQTKITNLAVGTAALENASVTNAKIANLAVSTAQIQDAAISNAKIANLAVDDAKIADISVTKLKAGTINTDLITIANSKIRMNNNGLYVYKNTVMGASLVEGNLTFYDQSNAQQIGMFAATVWSDSVTKGISMNMEANRYISFGHYVNSTVGYTPMMLLNPGTNMAGNVQGIHMNLPIRMNSDIWVGSNSLRFGLNNNHNHASIYKSAGDDLIVASYQSVGLAHIESGGVANTKLSIHPNEVKINVDATFYGANIRSYSDLWMGPKAVRFGTNQTHNHSAIWHSSGNDLILGSYQAVGIANISSGGVATTKFTVAATVNDSWQDLDMHGWKLLRVGEVDTTIGRMVADSNATYIQHNTEIRATRYKSTTYVPVRASSFPTGTSLRENKTDIEIFDEDALSVLRNINTYLYRVKGDEFKEHKQLGLMVDETPRVLHGEAGDSIEMYALSTYLVRGVQQLAIEFDTHADEINWLKIENQYLSQKVKFLEQRVRSLEDQFYAA